MAPRGTSSIRTALTVAPCQLEMFDHLLARWALMASNETGQIDHDECVDPFQRVRSKAALVVERSRDRPARVPRHDYVADRTVTEINTPSGTKRTGRPVTNKSCSENE